MESGLRSGWVVRVAGFIEPGYNASVKPSDHKHLQRLDRVWIRDPLFFVTATTFQRAQVLNSPAAHAICVEAWETGQRLHGWQVGRYVMMPDHVHFFCVPGPDAKPLETFVGKWKEWTAKFFHRRWGASMPLWQEEFFDHALRSQESYSQKWEYVRQNPVRAGLVGHAADWAYHGSLNDFRVDQVEML
jgi:REP element-mobilizing transposase RayT